jgi:predicted HicB family RNase H-like nuclease
MMTHKGYQGRVEFDDEAGLFHGEVSGTRDVITFQGRAVDELRQAFRDSVDDYLDWCAARGKAPDRPYSGRLLLRLDPAPRRAAPPTSLRAATARASTPGSRNGSPGRRRARGEAAAYSFRQARSWT